ncbi:MAG TPA: 1,4-alpha-glucan branching protein domain-containing protein, partial [Solirubrobacterales bacterium]|nr:1,4-alpha-glucan branching protein domain-containing protein [Solirubrobacterales bacterium]
PLAPFQRAAAEVRVALAASSATHAVLPMLATRQGVRLQLETGVRSHLRRFGWDGGFWLPECAYTPGLEWRLAEQGVRWFCVDQSAHVEPLEALAPVRTGAGPVALPIDWEAISWLWSLDGYPSDPAHAQFAGKSLRGIRIWRVGGGAYDPAAAEAAGVRLLTVPQALAEHEPVERPLRASTWGEGKDLRTWDSPAVADLATGARRLELRLLRAVAGGLRGAPLERAARELLAAQASDWAFLDQRKQAGDYAYQRATDHSRAMLEAIDCDPATDPRMRSLAPDLSLAPLLEP